MDAASSTVRLIPQPLIAQNFFFSSEALQHFILCIVWPTVMTILASDAKLSRFEKLASNARNCIDERGLIPALHQELQQP